MTNQELPEVYNPLDVESRWYRFWEEQDYFHAEAAAPKTPYSIAIPPPNVTGSLHLGHALSVTLQDALVRWRRMQAYNATWLPGTDHAGIVTQRAVEREIQRTENKTRDDFGREEFLQRVLAWKEKYSRQINDQMRTLGASLDWKRERFTLDEGLSRAVREAFVRLYDEGLIFQGRRLVAWCVSCRTALSDVEVGMQDELGSLWYVAYPVVGSPARLTFATTRPELIFGDAAVAVNPEDPRFRHLIGRQVRVPLTDREIPILGDVELVPLDVETGAVRITPGHDVSGFAAGQRLTLPQLSILGPDGILMAPAPKEYQGFDVVGARRKIVRDLEAQGFLVQTKAHRLPIERCHHCDTIVEPMISTQWFVKTTVLAEPAIAAVLQGKTKVVPESATQTYLDGMRNIREWCISRQIWWGHRIPAWTCQGCRSVMVARDAPLLCANCGGSDVRQDEDVLDTWFSSAVWPFATLGWPETTRDLKTFYPTTVMGTTMDNLFPWVARMMMMGLHFIKKVPFRTVLLYATVSADPGVEMPSPEGSPSVGVDALRFALTAMTGQGQDLHLSATRIQESRHFVEKIWNASRCALTNLQGFDADRFADALAGETFAVDLSLADRWILSRLQRTSKEVDEALESLRFGDAARTLYRFVARELCDQYIELCKTALGEPEPTDAAAVRRRELAQGTLAHCLETAMRLLHPIMPFVTEEIWQRLPRPTGVPASIMITLYPISDDRWIDDDAERQMAAALRAFPG